jgi:hypothetical protein
LAARASTSDRTAAFILPETIHSATGVAIMMARNTTV